jgi:hypothetical protein
MFLHGGFCRNCFARHLEFVVGEMHWLALNFHGLFNDLILEIADGT